MMTLAFNAARAGVPRSTRGKGLLLPEVLDGLLECAQVLNLEPAQKPAAKVQLRAIASTSMA